MALHGALCRLRYLIGTEKGRPLASMLDAEQHHIERLLSWMPEHGFNIYPAVWFGDTPGVLAGRARRSITAASFESLCASGASKRRQIRNIAVRMKTGFGDLPVRISAVLSLIPLNQAPAFKRVQSPREISFRQLLAAAPPAHVFHRP